MGGPIMFCFVLIFRNRKLTVDKELALILPFSED